MGRLYNILDELVNRSSIIEGGAVAAVSVPAGTYVDTSVTFSKTFKNVPRVVASLSSLSTSGEIGNMEVTAIYVSKTGCTIRIFNGGPSQRAPGATWVAIDS